MTSADQKENNANADAEVPVTKRALVIVDVQYDFIPGGSLQVTNGDKIVGIVNDIRAKYEKKFDLVALSMDWHPPNHCSFCANNIARDPTVKLFMPCKLANGSTQIMWPNHCVQGSDGARIHKDLKRLQSDKIVLKGMNPEVDTYSAFMDQDKKTKTALEGLLREAKITEIFVVGIAYDVCAGFTALDGAALGFKTHIIKDSAASVSPEGHAERELQFKEAGVNMILVADLEELLV